MALWRSALLASVAAAVGAAAPTRSGDRVGNATVELYLLPHTHADVGWLETPENLARVNVSRILDGVVGNLGNDTKKRRRFVWDEMYFLQWWWENRATAQQQATFHSLVQEGRIEFVGFADIGLQERQYLAARMRQVLRLPDNFLVF